MKMEDEEERPPLAVQIDKPAQERSYSSKNADVSVGVTVITGFLGAGKSTVVDAKNLLFQINKYHEVSSFPEAIHQIAFADVIILNKIDLVSLEASEDTLDKLEKEIHEINSLAHIIRSARCQVDLSKILNCRAYDATHVTHLQALLEEHQSVPSSDLHDSGVRTLCICEQQAVDLDKVRLWLEEILWDKKYGMDVYRCKGVLNIQKSDQLHILQAVREIYEVVPARKWRTDENRMNKIVFIGHYLSKDVLTNSFRTCVLSTT